MYNRDLTDLFELRFKIYSFLSIALLRQPNKAELEDFLKNAIARDKFQSYYFENTASVKEVQSAIEASREGWEALLREYSYIFEGTDGRVVILWESGYFGSKNILCDETTLKVKRFYKKHKIGVRKEEKQICDHIGLELSFLLWLNIELAESILQRNNKAFDENIEDQKFFIHNHLLEFSAHFLNCVQENTQNPYYLWLSRFLYDFVKKDLEIVSGLDYPADENFTVSLPSKPTIGLRLLDENELQDEPVKVVPTSGRNNCGGRCIVNVHVQEGNILKLSTSNSIGPDREENLMSCARGKSYRKSFLNVNRLRYPMKRIGERGEGKFQRITWEEAVDTIAEKIHEMNEKYGPLSRYVNYSSGARAGNGTGGDLMAKRLLSIDGGFLQYYLTYSSACTTVATPYTYGTTASGSTTDNLIYSKLIVLWGYNPLETAFNISSHHDILKAKKAGIKIIVVDPRYSDSAAAFADQWIGLRPTTDSALIDAMAYVILMENLQDQAFMDKYCLGFDREHMPEGLENEETYLDYVFGKRDGIPKTPEWASEITGVEKDVIIQFAREYATSKPAALLQGLGPQRNANGEQTVRSTTMLTCLTGNVGIKGGGAGGAGRGPQHGLVTMKYHETVSIPCFMWTDAIVRGKELTAKNARVRGAEALPSPIKMIFNLAGNILINQHGDINRTAQILKDTSKCEFIVCSELFMTPSARFADILLPGTSMFEASNVAPGWGGSYVLYGSQAIEPLFDVRPEYDWLVEVAEKLGIKEEFTDGHESLNDWVKHLYNETRKIEPELPEFEEFTRQGGYQYKHRSNYIAFEKQIKDFENNPFPTPSGKIEIFSKRLYDLDELDEIPAIPKYIPCPEGPGDPLRGKYPLQLTGWHTKRRAHSTHDHNDWNLAIDRQELWINPADAESRSIKEDDLVDIYNDRGRVRIPAHVTNRIVKGVVGISQGAWFTPDDKGTDVNGSINTLTSARPTPLAKGNPSHTNLVEVMLSNVSAGRNSGH